MSLPEGFDRDNNKMYEEVNLPPSTDAPDNVGQNLISISDLDEVGGKMVSLFSATFLMCAISSTVEPLYNGHLRDWAKVTLIAG